MNNTPTLEIDEDTHDYITRIHPLNYKHIRDTLPHRLYIDENGGKIKKTALGGLFFALSMKIVTIKRAN